MQATRKSGENVLAAPDRSKISESVFLRACRREPVPYTPVWLMRQAGRYQADFRELRSRVGFLDLCKNPELASQVTVKAVEDTGVDAAIIFADILLPLDALDAQLTFAKGEGPQIGRPVRDAHDVYSLPDSIDVEARLGYVFEAIELSCRKLPSHIPLIGFAGAPFTLTSYLVEGGSSRNYEHTKILMHNSTAAWHNLMERLVALSVDYLCGQVRAGASALQLFDSWVGCLSPQDFGTFVMPHLRNLLGALSRLDVPLIYFSTGTASLMEQIATLDADVIGLDWRVNLASAWENLPGKAVQGNMDPCALLCDRETVRKEATSILRQVNGKTGHIFNLGHGVLPPTSMEQVRYLVDLVHNYPGPSSG